MRELAKKILRSLGFKLIRLKSKRTLPVPTLDNIEIVVKFYQLMKQPISLLQIGACDGVTSDSIYKYIKQGNIKAYLVEPSSVNFNKLKLFYNAQPDVTLINSAISDRDARQTFYSIRDEGRWKDNGWARQLASFYKQHLIKHGILEHEIQEEEVDCATVQSVLTRYGISNLDVLIIDTEGYDGEIVKMALAQNVLPNFIAFENVQLVKTYRQHELTDLYNKLKEKGYVWTHDRINTLAVKAEFFNG
jgi:FkbM family methyltransferase